MKRMKGELGMYPDKQRGYTATFKTKFWTPQCQSCLELLDDDQPYCSFGKEPPRRLIRANLERDCHLKAH